MKTYKVTLVTEYTIKQYHDVYVHAESEDEAERLAPYEDNWVGRRSEPFWNSSNDIPNDLEFESMEDPEVYEVSEVYNEDED